MSLCISIVVLSVLNVPNVSHCIFHLHRFTVNMFSWFMFVNKYIDKSNDVTRQQKNRCLRFHFEVNQHSHRTPGANLKLRHFNGNNLDVMQLKTNESTRFSFCYCCCSLPGCWIVHQKKTEKNCNGRGSYTEWFHMF